MTRIVINESYAILRANKRLVSYEEYMSDEQAVEEDEYSPVFEEITKMKEKYRIPFVLHYVEGYTTAEIAKMLSLSEGAVKTQLFRARNQLKAQLKGVDGYERMEL